MKENYFELVIIGFIQIGIAVAIFKGGAANPQGTGALGKRLYALDQEVKRIDAKAATKADVKRIEATLTEQSSSIDNIEQKLGKLGEDGAAREATLEHVRRQVDLIYQTIVQRGMKL